MSGWHDGPMLAVDTETSGRDPHTARVVQIGLARIVPGEGVSAQLYLVDPGIEIPDEAAAIHGLTTEHVREHGQQPAEVLRKVGAALGDWLDQGLPIVAMNAAYDCTLLEAELARHGITSAGLADGPVIDPFVIDKHVDTYRRGSRKLEALCQHYGVRLDGAHDAGYDAMAAARVAWRIGKVHPLIGGLSLPELHQAQVGWAREQADSLRAYFDSRGTAHDGCDGTWPVRRARQEVAA